MIKHQLDLREFPQLSNGIRYLSIVSLVLTLLGCQTFDAQQRQKEDDALKTQLALAANQLDQGAPERSLFTLRPIYRMHPDNADLLTLMGMSHLALGNKEMALKFLREAYKSRPDVKSGLNLSSGLIADRQYRKARNVARKLLKRKEDYPYKERLFHNLAVAYERDRKFKGAIINYKKAIAINPVFYMSLIQLGKIYLNFGNLKQAELYLTKAQKSCQVCLEPVQNLSQLLLKQGKKNDAVTLISNYIQISAVKASDKASAKKLLKFARNHSVNKTLPKRQF